MSDSPNKVIVQKKTPRRPRGTSKDQEIYAWVSSKVGPMGVRQIEKWLERAIVLLLDIDNVQDQIEKHKETSRPEAQVIFESPQHMIEYLMEEDKYLKRLRELENTRRKVEEELQRIAMKLDPVFPDSYKVRCVIAGEEFVLKMISNEDHIGLSIISRSDARATTSAI